MSGNSSGTFTNLVGLECPVCLQLPRKEVYQCLNGHSICNSCLSKVQRCPSCRVFIIGSSGITVRNIYAETLLDGMKFGCSWNEHGCQKVTTRSQLSNHEKNCKFGPINLCKEYKNCQFLFHPMSLTNTNEANKVLEHMKSAHNFNVVKNACLGSLWTYNIGQEQIQYINDLETVNFEPIFFQVVHPDSLFEELFIVLCKSQTETGGQKFVSWEFVRLMSKSMDLDLIVKVDINMGGQPMEISADWGKEYLTEPSLSWSLKPKDGQYFMDLLKAPKKDRPSFFFKFSFVQIQDLYATNEIFTLRYSIHKI